MSARNPNGRIPYDSPVAITRSYSDRWNSGATHSS